MVPNRAKRLIFNCLSSKFSKTLFALVNKDILLTSVKKNQKNLKSERSELIKLKPDFHFLLINAIEMPWRR